MTEVQKQLIDLRPGQTGRINGRWVAGTYRGWLIALAGSGPLADSMLHATSLPEAVTELEGGKLTDAA
jgi:hypothetical protein